MWNLVNKEMELIIYLDYSADSVSLSSCAAFKGNLGVH